MRRAVLATVLVAAMGLLIGSGVGAAPPATPPCPPVDGWTSAGTFGPIDNGNAVQFQCEYSLPGQANQLTLDMHWYKPSARDVDVDYSECGRVTAGGSYYAFLWSKTFFVHEEYVVNSGSADSNVALFKADQERIRKAALTLLASTEKLAKPCSKTPPAVTDTRRPTVKLRPVTGRAGSTVAFPFTVADNSGRVDIVLVIYNGPARAKVLFRKDYGKATAPSRGRRYQVKIRVHAAARDLWCVTATDAARNHATSCAALTIA